MTSSLRPITCVSPLEWLEFGCVASFRRGRGPFLDLVVLSACFELDRRNGAVQALSTTAAKSRPSASSVTSAGQHSSNWHEPKLWERQQ